MSKYLVSICIPTYNRAPYLKKSLDSLSCQPEFQRGLVEIVVSDNASTDDTEKLIETYQAQYDNIKYYRNDSNIGFKNLGVAIARGTGTLRKLSNDTIQYNKHSLQKFCAAVQMYRQSMPVLFWSNGQTKKRLCTNDPNEFLREVSFYITWSGGFSIWGSDCNGVFEEALESQSELWHTECLCRLIAQRRSLIICPEVFGRVQTVSRKNISYGLYKVFYENYLGILHRLVDQKVLSLTCFEAMKKDLLYRFFKGWIIQWELQNTGFQFSETENLKKLVFEKYQREKYFPHFLQTYKKDLARTKLKNFIKQIPFLGSAAGYVRKLITLLK